MTDDATAPPLKCSAEVFFDALSTEDIGTSDATQAFVDETVSYFKAMTAVDFSKVLDTAASGLQLGDGACAIDPGRHLLHNIAARVLAGDVVIADADPLVVTSLLLQNLKPLEYAASVVRLHYHITRCLELMRSCSKQTLILDEYHIRTSDFFATEKIYRKGLLSQPGQAAE